MVAQWPCKVLLSLGSHKGCRHQQKSEVLYTESMAIGVRYADQIVQVWPDGTSLRSVEDVFSTDEPLRAYEILYWNGVLRRRRCKSSERLRLHLHMREYPTPAAGTGYGI